MGVSRFPKYSVWIPRISWTLQIALAAIFCITASRKFLADPVPVETIEALGTGQWLRIAIGVAELAGALGLLIPRTALLASLCLSLLMLGALATHILVIGGSFVPALLLLLSCISVATLRYVRTDG